MKMARRRAAVPDRCSARADVGPSLTLTKRDRPLDHVARRYRRTLVRDLHWDDPAIDRGGKSMRGPKTFRKTLKNAYQLWITQ
jgi:hypothetical protein